MNTKKITAKQEEKIKGLFAHPAIKGKIYISNTLRDVTNRFGIGIDELTREEARNTIVYLKKFIKRIQRS